VILDTILRSNCTKTFLKNSRPVNQEIHMDVYDIYP